MRVSDSVRTSVTATMGARLAAPTGAMDLLLDRTWLSELVGEPAVASRIRHKPGVSTVAAYGTPAGIPAGWMQLVAPRARDKVANAVRRADERDRPIVTMPAPDGWTVMHGPLLSDPRLHRALDQLPADLRGDLGQRVTATVLRYNPHRRLVLHRGDTVLRLTASCQAQVSAAAKELAGHGIPVVVPGPRGDIGAGRRVSVWPWVAGDDLLRVPDAGAARDAGSVLARLHSVPLPRAGAALPAAAPATALRGVVAEVWALAPDLTGRVEDAVTRVLGRVGAHPGGHGAVWSHGDLSADQVLVEHAGHVRVLDIDRTCRAAPGLDLGSFRAVELLRADAGDPVADLSADLVQGYRTAGGVVPRPDVLGAWTAYALLTRMTAPVRHAWPTWRTDLVHRLGQIEQVLA